jgi:hypothetical protein
MSRRSVCDGVAAMDGDDAAGRVAYLDELRFVGVAVLRIRAWRGGSRPALPPLLIANGSDRLLDDGGVPTPTPRRGVVGGVDRRSVTATYRTHRPTQSRITQPRFKNVQKLLLWAQG